MSYLPEGAILMMTNAAADDEHRKPGFFYCSIVDPTWPKTEQEAAIVESQDPNTCLWLALQKYWSIRDAQTTEIPHT